MSVHEVLKQDKTYHFIEQEHKGIKYCYASNIQEDNILAIIKYTMPKEIEQALNTPIYHSRDMFYIVVGQEHGQYYMHLSFAQSENLNYSHTDVLRINADNTNDLITKYIQIKENKKFTVKCINAITGGAVQIPLYVS